MYEPVVVPPKKSGSTLRIVLIIVGILLVLCCAAGVAGFFFFKSVASGLPEARTAANEYLADIQAERMDAAYGRLCSATRGRMSLDAFSNRMTGLRAYEIVGVTVRNMNGRETAVVSIRATAEDGTVLNQGLSLSKEGDRWVICDE